MSPHFPSVSVRARLRVAITVAALSLAALVSGQSIPVNALPQAAFTIPLNQATPVDPRITIGTLPNGLKYYIRENQEPKNRAELRLVVNAGSLLEDENQLGLAHVLEHLAFNGTEHFPKHEIVSFIEKIGMRFGADLNASTSFDETMYQLQVPMDKPEYLDTALEVMEDWAHAITLDPAEVEAERGVVAEEWRRSLGAGDRIRKQTLPVLLKGSHYPDRFPIGTIDSIEHFEPKALRQFYQDWYRPDLMAVVVVGDFNKADVEKRVIEHFSKVPAAKAPRTKPSFPVPPTPGTSYVIATDAEVSGTSVSVQRKLPPNDDWTPGGMKQRYIQSVYNSMLSQRLQEASRQPNAPFLGAQSSSGSLVREADVYQLAARAQETGVKRGLEAILIEAERVRRFGFTQTEFDRTKTAMQRGIEQLYASRNNRTSGSHAAEMVRSYLSGESMPGAEFEIALQMRFLREVTLDEVTKVGKDWLSDDNRVVIVTMPKKEGLVPPTEAELKEVMNTAMKADIKPYVDTTNDAPLLSSRPTPSKVVSTRTLAGDIIEWTLANGVKVAIKPTDFRKDEILFSAFSPGGTSQASDAEYLNADAATLVAASGGLGSFNVTDLQRKLTGKVARVTPFISDYEEGIQGGGSPADLETMMQLIYLRFTAPRLDPVMLQTVKNQMITGLQNRDSVPGNVYSDAFMRELYQNHPRRQPPSVEMIQQIDPEKAMAFYKKRFADASDFTFVFAGDIDLKVLQPLVEMYLGGLPSTGRKETWKDIGVHVLGGVKETNVKRGIDPKANTRIVFNGPMKALDPIERLHLNVSSIVLQTRLRERLREQLGGTYSVGVSPQISWRPDQSFMITIEFGSAPERVEELKKAVDSEIEKLKQSGPTETELANAKAEIVRSNETGLRQNSTWMTQLVYTYSSGQNNGVENLLAVPENVQKLTLASLQTAFRDYFSGKNRLTMSLLPE